MENNEFLKKHFEEVKKLYYDDGVNTKRYYELMVNKYSAITGFPISFGSADLPITPPLVLSRHAAVPLSVDPTIYQTSSTDIAGPLPADGWVLDCSYIAKIPTVVNGLAISRVNPFRLSVKIGLHSRTSGFSPGNLFGFGVGRAGGDPLPQGSINEPRPPVLTFAPNMIVTPINQAYNYPPLLNTNANFFTDVFGGGIHFLTAAAYDYNNLKIWSNPYSAEGNICAFSGDQLSTPALASNLMTNIGSTFTKLSSVSNDPNYFENTRVSFEIYSVDTNAANYSFDLATSWPVSYAVYINFNGTLPIYTISDTYVPNSGIGTWKMTNVGSHLFMRTYIDDSLAISNKQVKILVSYQVNPTETYNNKWGIFFQFARTPSPLNTTASTILLQSCETPIGYR
jgi:hypothetical protein